MLFLVDQLVMSLCEEYEPGGNQPLGLRQVPGNFSSPSAAASPRYLGERTYPPCLSCCPPYDETRYPSFVSLSLFTRLEPN